MQWLLDSDPSIRWQVMRDLLHESDEIVAARAPAALGGAWRLSPVVRRLHAGEPSTLIHAGLEEVANRKVHRDTG